jgi:hypothetical protein
MQRALRRLVWQRADSRCEYCRIPQSAISETFHIEHVIARNHAGKTSNENLALACNRCNLFKGVNLSGIDPLTGVLCRLFNPRADAWDDHFALDDDAIVGRSAIGRTTANLLRFNQVGRRQLRAILLERNEF